MAKTKKRLKFHTRLCDVLGIEYPIMQAGMGGFSDPPLVIAVSEAGGLGTLGAATYESDTLDAAIKEIRKGTSKPFAIDILLPDSLKDLEGISKEGLMKFIPDEYYAYGKELRKKFGVPDDFHSNRGGALFTMEGTKGLVQVCLDNKVPVIVAGLGRVGWFASDCKRLGIKTIAIGANVDMAMKHVEDKVDVIVAQGYDAGGHTGEIGTMSVVPQVVDAVKPIPVAAAGGIADGRGLVAALSLGAEGVWCGSAFLVSDEVTATEPQKDRWIAATERDARISKAISGKTMRQLRTPLTEIWDKGPMKPLGWPFQNLLTLDIVEYVYANKDVEKYDQLLVSPCSQAARLLTKKRSSKQIIDDMVAQATQVLEEGLPGKVQLK